MILLIDNYDSFSYNLYHLIGKFNRDILVLRNNEKSVQEIAALKPQAVFLSPGPGKPGEAGICIELIQKLAPAVPIFGVCLGHQAICEAFGGVVSYAAKLMHGKKDRIQIDADCPIFRGMPQEIEAARYHSLAARKESLPACLKIAAVSSDNEIMAVYHKNLPVFGVQFHPESIMTPNGETMIQNFFSYIQQ